MNSSHQHGKLCVNSQCQVDGRWEWIHIGLPLNRTLDNKKNIDHIIDFRINNQYAYDSYDLYRIIDLER